LCEVAGMRLENFADGKTPQTAVVSGTLVERQSKPAPERPSWDSMSSQDQALHLQAQRVARVRVAEIRIHQRDALAKGFATRDVYGALRENIDAARQQFLQTFLSKSPTMVDYLHLEILKNLANDDDGMLGSGYPGPMV
jgi:hypothetical protein